LPAPTAEALQVGTGGAGMFPCLWLLNGGGDCLDFEVVVQGCLGKKAWLLWVVGCEVCHLRARSQQGWTAACRFVWLLANSVSTTLLPCPPCPALCLPCAWPVVPLGLQALVAAQVARERDLQARYKELCDEREDLRGALQAVPAQ